MENPWLLLGATSFGFVALICSMLVAGVRPRSLPSWIACLAFPPLFALAAGGLWLFSTFYLHGELRFIPLLFWLGIAALAVGAVVAAVVVFVGALIVRRRVPSGRPAATRTI